MEWNNLKTVLERYSTALQNSTDRKVPSDWNLKYNFKFQINGDFYEISFSAPDYWKYVEDGRSAGKMPPINKIADWIERRRITPYSVNNKVPTTNQLAFLISRSIGRNGVEGKHIVEDSVKSNDFETAISDAITKDIVEEFKTFLVF